MKNRPVGAEFIHADNGRADGRADMTKLKVAFRNYANVPAKGILPYTYIRLQYTYLRHRAQSTWEVNWFSYSQEIPRILWNQKTHYHIYKCPPFSIFWARSIQSISHHPTSWRSILILSSHQCMGLPRGVSSSGSPPKPSIHLSSLLYVLHA